MRPGVSPAIPITCFALLFAAGVRSARAQIVVSGTSVDVAADATDNVGVVGVQFFLDGTALGAEDLAAPYGLGWNTTSWSDGVHTLTARARDAAGNTGVSPPVEVTVDNQAAAVGLVAPLPGSAVAGVVSLTATASDNVGVDVVRFFVDGTLIASDFVAPYSASWNTASHPDGGAVITLVAVDVAGNTTTSPGVAVTVSNSSPPPPPDPDTSPPSIGLTGPVPGSTVSGSVVVSASATDDTGVVGVQFLLNGAPLGAEDSTAPYRVTWDTTAAADGAYTLAARARDAAGNQATSVPVVVTVSNPPAPEPDPDAEAAAMGPGTVRLSISPSETAFRRIEAHTDGGDRMEVYIDGQKVADAAGRTVTYDWDARTLVGSREVRVVTLEGTSVVATASLFYDVASTVTRSVTLELAYFPIIGASLIQGHTAVAGLSRVELYVEGKLKVSQTGSELEHAWSPQSGRVYEILLAVYDGTGVAGSVRVVHSP